MKDSSNIGRETYFDLEFSHDKLKQRAEVDFFNLNGNGGNKSFISPANNRHQLNDDEENEDSVRERRAYSALDDELLTSYNPKDKHQN
jgi:hypothetical protein